MLLDISITDWIQTIFSAGSFILTAAGLYYVAATLREQSRVNQAQFQLLEIEARRAAKEFKPVLSVIRLSDKLIIKQLMQQRKQIQTTLQSASYLCSLIASAGLS